MSVSTVGRPKSAEEIQRDWDTNPRWMGVNRTYTAADVIALQGSVVEEQTLARRGAEVLWSQLRDMEFVNALGALTGNMAVQQVRDRRIFSWRIPPKKMCSGSLLFLHLQLWRRREDWSET